MAWRIDGIGNTYRHAAANAARRAGLTLGEWLDRVVLSHPAGPTREETDSQITEALKALETRIDGSSQRLGQIIEPLKAEVDRLSTESEYIRSHGSEGLSRAEREIARQMARLDTLSDPSPRLVPPAAPRTDGRPRLSPQAPGIDPEADNHDPWTRHHPHTIPPLPGDKALRRRQVIRYVGAIGAVILIAGSIATMSWLLAEHEDEALGPSEAVRRDAAVAPSADQTPPPGIALIAPPPAPAGAATAPASDMTLPNTPAGRETLRAKAEERDPDAEYLLGVALLQGKGGPVNVREAGEWIAAAALAGQPQAQLQLARLYTHGTGLPRDLSQAFFWTQSAAEQGITEAEFDLGMIYFKGAGVDRSYPLSARWFQLAGAKKHAAALYQLGQIYELGLDYRANRGRAMEWYRKAADAGSKAAAEKLAALAAAPKPASALAAVPPPAAAPAPAPAPKAAALTGPGLTRDEIVEIQRLLKGLDFDPGATDGRVTRQTTDAIRQFQDLTGGGPYGQVSRALLLQLREIAGPAR